MRTVKPEHLDTQSCSDSAWDARERLPEKAAYTETRRQGAPTPTPTQCPSPSQHSRAWASPAPQPPPTSSLILAHQRPQHVALWP